MSIRNLAILVVLCFGISTVAHAGPDLLSGDEASACEAMLCLAAPARPGECAASIAKYFSINFKKPWKTLKARLNFLNLCPVTDGGTTAETIQENYGHCGVGAYESASCSMLGYGQTVTGNCFLVDGQTCREFVAGNEPAPEATFGICWQQARAGGPFDQIEPVDRNSCTRFRAELPFDFGRDATAVAAR